MSGIPDVIPKSLFFIEVEPYWGEPIRSENEKKQLVAVKL